MADYRFVSSSDDGAHFSAEQQLAGSLNLSVAPLDDDGRILYGYYQGLAASGACFQAMFVSTNANSPDNRTDIVTAGVTL